MLLLLFAVAGTVAQVQEYCNQGTSHLCTCSSCWDDLPIDGAIDWITVETDGCGDIDEKLLRTKLASWSTEECGSSVHCGMQLPIAGAQILLGHLSCNATTRAGAISLALLAGPEANDALEQGSLLPAPLLGAILHSREHLLAIALRAHLTSVTITRHTPSVPKRETSATPPHTTTTTTAATTTMPVPHYTVSEHADGDTTEAPRMFFTPTSSLGVALAVTCFTLAILSLIIYAVWGRIEWKRMVEGRWKRRVYRKVPNVMFRSADEMPTVIPHSTSAHSTIQLIRY